MVVRAWHARQSGQTDIVGNDETGAPIVSRYLSARDRDTLQGVPRGAPGALMDLLAISDALALRYASLTPPAGLKAITASTSRPPNNIPNTPYVIAWPQSGDVTLTSGQGATASTSSRSSSTTPRARPTSRASTSPSRSGWASCSTPPYGQLQLGLGGTVVKAIPMKWEIGSVVYAGDQYEVITLTSTSGRPKP